MTRRQRRDAKKYTYNGKTQTVREWSEELGVTPKNIKRRMSQGRPPEEVFSPDMRIGNDYGADKRKYFRKLEREMNERKYGCHHGIFEDAWNPGIDGEDDQKSLGS